MSVNEAAWLRDVSVSLRHTRRRVGLIVSSRLNYNLITVKDDLFESVCGTMLTY